MFTKGKNTDYYLEVKSNAKQMKEAGIKNQFEQRFEEALQRIDKGVHSKGGIKQADKVHQRIGRAKERSPSVQQYYIIDVSGYIIDVSVNDTYDQPISIRKCSEPNQNLKTFMIP